jgi:hypothetical protein
MYQERVWGSGIRVPGSLALLILRGFVGLGYQVDASQQDSLAIRLFKESHDHL